LIGREFFGSGASCQDWVVGCIEAGVDIPTVSRWLGHQDGGVLCMKTYGHLRDEHSQNEAQKVSFWNRP